MNRRGAGFICFKQYNNIYLVSLGSEESVKLLFFWVLKFICIMLMSPESTIRHFRNELFVAFILSSLKLAFVCVAASGEVPTV